MKKALILIASLFILLSAKAQMQHQKGMHMQHIPYSEVLEKAKKENKKVFVDCFTTWCGPCKWMAANTFTDDTVGNFFNHYFINLKMDMEHGEGPSLAPKWQIQAYPTLLFMNSNGSIFKREMGAMPPTKFIEIAKIALGADANLDSLLARYKAGNKSLYNLESIILLMQIGKMDYKKYLNEYFDQQKKEEWSNEMNFDVIKNYSFDITAPEVEYMIKNKAEFEKKYAGEVNIVLKKIALANINSTEKKKANAAKDLMKIFEEKK